MTVWAWLSKSIGITQPRLYLAFGNKRSLFEQVLKQYVNTNGGWLPAVLSEAGEVGSVVTHLFVRAAEVYTVDPERCGCLVMDATRNCDDEGARALTVGFQQATRQLIGDRISAGEPALSVSESAVLADYVMTILMGLSSRARARLSTALLTEIAAIAGTGFSQRLQQYREMS